MATGETRESDTWIEKHSKKKIQRSGLPETTFDFEKILEFRRI